MNGGSIVKRGEGVYEVALQTGYNPITKKYGRTSRRVHGTKQDALNALDDLRQMQKTGLKPDAGKTTFGEFSLQWFERGKQTGEWCTNTAKRYKTMLATFNGYLASVPLSQIDPQTIDALYLAIKDDRGITNTTLQKHHVLLKQILQQAVQYDLILRNPCDRVKAPKREKVERNSLTHRECKRLLACIVETRDNAYKENDEKETRQTQRGNLFGRSYLMDISNISRAIGAQIGLSTGARRGEILALTWAQVDLEGATATITQSINATDEIKEPKTAAGVRCVALDKTLVQALATWKQYQASQLLKLGLKTSGNTPVVCDAKGGYMNPSNFSHWWDRFRKANGFAGLKFHELRHTQATMLIANGADVKTVQTRLGHASASVTLNMYAHAIPANDRKAAETIEKIFGEGQEAARIVEVKTA